MDYVINKLSNIGGIGGGLFAYLLNISPFHIIEIGLYALIGSIVGEGVKEAVIFFKKKKVI